MNTGRFLAVVVALFMVLTMLPVTVQAGDQPWAWVNDTWMEWDEIGYNESIRDPGFEHLKKGVNAFDSVQQAIDAVEAGGVVNVLPGEYLEGENGPHGNLSLYIDKALTLQGVTADGTPITSADHVAAVILGQDQDTAEGTSYRIDADNVTITGMHLRPYRSGITEGEDWIACADSVLFVTGDNFFLHNSLINTYGGPGDFDGRYNIFSVTFSGADAQSGLVYNNILYGGVRLIDGAGEGGIDVEGNFIRHELELGAITVRNSYRPSVIGNNIVLNNQLGWPSFYAVLATATLNSETDTQWLFDILERNTFNSAYAIVTNLETIEVRAVGDYIYAYESLGSAATHAEEGDTIIVFHPSTAVGVDFHSGQIPLGTQLALLPGPHGGPVVFLPRASLPAGIYTVRVTQGDPPVGLPAGYELVGGANFTITLDGDPLEQFNEGEPAFMWLPYPDELDPANLAFFRYDAVAEEWQELSFEVNGPFLVVETPRWSYFALMAGEPAEPSEPVLPITGTRIMWLIPLGMVLLLAGAMTRKRLAA